MPDRTYRTVSGNTRTDRNVEGEITASVAVSQVGDPEAPTSNSELPNRQACEEIARKHIDAIAAPLAMRAAWQQVAAEAEAIMSRHSEGDFFDSYHERRDCAACPQVYFPCLDAQHAQAIRVTALAQINALNEAQREEA